MIRLFSNVRIMIWASCELLAWYDCHDCKRLIVSTNIYVDRKRVRRSAQLYSNWQNTTVHDNNTAYKTANGVQHNAPVSSRYITAHARTS